MTDQLYTASSRKASPSLFPRLHGLGIFYGFVVEAVQSTDSDFSLDQIKMLTQ
jgi:hypothetical protein